MRIRPSVVPDLWPRALQKLSQEAGYEERLRLIAAPELGATTNFNWRMNMKYQYGVSQEAAARAQQVFATAASGALNAQIAAPPQPTRFSSCAGRLEEQVNHLFASVERASRVADRLGGAIPQEVAGLNKATPNSSSVAAIIEEQNERLDIALMSFLHALERLEQL